VTPERLAHQLIRGLPPGGLLRHTTRNPGTHSRLQRMPDIHGEHGGVAQHEYLETGISGGRECGDAHGVAGMLTPTALLAVAIDMWQAWLP
jgi:hypothetical protein